MLICHIKTTLNDKQCYLNLKGTIRYNKKKGIKKVSIRELHAATPKYMTTSIIKKIATIR